MSEVIFTPLHNAQEVMHRLQCAIDKCNPSYLLPIDLTVAISAIREKQTRDKSGCACACGETDKDFCATCNRIRVEAIREKLDREKPQPLEDYDLLQRTGQPVYVDEYYLDEDGLMTRIAGWDVIKEIHLYPPDGIEQDTVEMKSGDVWPIGDPRVKFYAHKPKKESLLDE